MTVSRLNIQDVETVFDIAHRDPKKFYLKIMHKADSMDAAMRATCLSKEEVIELQKKAQLL